jgi:hypothetical protein
MASTTAMGALATFTPILDPMTMPHPFVSSRRAAHLAPVERASR